MTMVRKRLEREWKATAAEDAKRLAQQAPVAGVDIQRGIPYLADGEPMHQLNLYRPADVKGPLPTLVNIHGGGWMYGDADLNRNHCAWLAAQGFALMGMSYRLLPHTNLKGMVQDIFASLHWLQAHAAEYGFDLDNAYLFGDSAGGHLTGLVACIQLSDKLQRLYGVQPVSFSFGAIAILHGVCNLSSLGFAKGPAGRLVDREMHRMLFGPRPRQVPWYGHASFQETAQGLALPPVMVVSSDVDALHPQSQQLAAYLETRGARHETLFWHREQNDKLGHVFEVLWPDWPESIQTNRAMLDFFLNCRGTAGASAE